MSSGTTLGGVLSRTSGNSSSFPVALLVVVAVGGVAGERGREDPPEGGRLESGGAGSVK